MSALVESGSSSSSAGEIENAIEMEGIKTENFGFDLINDMKIIGQIMIMDQSCYIWIGESTGDCCMSSLATAMPTRFQVTCKSICTTSHIYIYSYTYLNLYTV